MILTNMLNLTETSTNTPPMLSPSSNDPLAFYQPTESLLSETTTSRNTCHNSPNNQTPVTTCFPENEVTQSRKAEQVVLSGMVNYQAGSSTPVKATSSSIVSLPSTSSSLHFSPDIVRPLPKAPPRKNSTRGRKRGKSAIYTDTPEKEAIRKEYEEKERKKRAKGVKKSLSKSKNTKGKKPKNKILRKKEHSESGEEEWFCSVCIEAYSNSKSNEIWIQCSQCRLWAHEDCTPQMGFSYTYLL